MHVIPEQWMGLVATGIFMATYMGIAAGCVPGLVLDRTGIALLGAIAMVATGALAMPQALQALDAPTLLLLYALMVVSAQFRVGGFYTWTVLQLRRFMPREKLFLLLVMAVTAVMSAAIVNDVVCLAFTPVLAVALLQAGLDPVPLAMEFSGPKGRGWLMRWLPTRAYENGVYYVFSNAVGVDWDTIKTGGAMVLDPFGEIVAESRALGDDVVVALCTPEKVELSGGRRYLRARRPEKINPRNGNWRLVFIQLYE